MRYVDLPYDIRNRHVYICGGTQRGKSTLMRRMFYWDVKNDCGCAFFDPKGTHIDKILYWIPDHRINDCIYLDLDHPVPLDLLSYSSPRTKQALIKDLTYIIAKNTTAEHAPTMHSILNNVINTILDANEHPDNPKRNKASFLDIGRFLENEQRQRQILKYVRTDTFQHKWPPFAAPLSRNEIAPTLRRMTEWSNNPVLGAIMGNPNADECLNVADVVNNRKILLVNLGGTGTDRWDWAALLLAKIQEAAFARYKVPEEYREPFYCYLDEFQNFKATENIDQMLSMAGELQLCLVMANQYLHQVKDLFPAIIGNVSSYILFQISRDDSLKFRHLLPENEIIHEQQRRRLEDQIIRLETELRILAQKGNRPDLLKRIENLQTQIAVKKSIYVTMPAYDPITVADLTALPPHVALYKIGDDPPIIKPTPEPAPPPTPEQLRKAELIKKRPVDVYGFTAPPKGVVKDDDDFGDDGPTIPPDDPKAGRSSQRRPPRTHDH